LLSTQPQIFSPIVQLVSIYMVNNSVGIGNHNFAMQIPFSDTVPTTNTNIAVTGYPHRNSYKFQSVVLIHLHNRAALQFKFHKPSCMAFIVQEDWV